MAALDIERADFLKDDDIVIFENSVGKFFDEHAPPERVESWRREGIVERSFWREAGEAGLLCLAVPEEYGGPGGDFRHEVVLMEAIAKKQISGFAASLHNAIIAPYILHYGSEEQKWRWLPKMASGEFIGAIAMTEPGAGSDLQGVKTTARLDGNQYVINGQKTFISNGQLADLVIVVAKTDPAKGAKGTSLIVVETADAPGFRTGAQPRQDRHGGAGHLRTLLRRRARPDREPARAAGGPGLRPTHAAIAAGAPDDRDRRRRGDRAGARRHHRLRQGAQGVRPAADRLPEYPVQARRMQDRGDGARVFIDRLIGLHLEGKLDAATASMAKYWVSELESKIVDACLQLFGGYGYMNEYPIARMFRDSRVQRIYGGANEIMKVLIARTL